MRGQKIFCPSAMVHGLIILVFVFGYCFSVFAQEVTPPTNVKAIDTPNDDGKSISISWEKSSDDGAGAENVTGYKVLRKPPDDEFEEVASIPAGTTHYVDAGTERGLAYSYIVQAITAA